MIVTRLAETLVLWSTFLATVAAAAAPRLGRWPWWLAMVMAAAWLGLAGYPVVALALALGATAAAAIEGGESAGDLDSTGLLPSLLAIAVGLGGAALTLARVIHAEPALGYQAFPALAASLIAVAVLALAARDKEQLRAARFLLVMAAVVWTVAGGSGAQEVAVVSAAWLPVLAGADRLRRKEA